MIGEVLAGMTFARCCLQMLVTWHRCHLPRLITDV